MLSWTFYPRYLQIPVAFTSGQCFATGFRKELQKPVLVESNRTLNHSNRTLNHSNRTFESFQQNFWTIQTELWTIWFVDMLGDPTSNPNSVHCIYQAGSCSLFHFLSFDSNDNCSSFCFISCTLIKTWWFTFYWSFFVYSFYFCWLNLGPTHSARWSPVNQLCPGAQATIRIHIKSNQNCIVMYVIVFLRVLFNQSWDGCTMNHSNRRHFCWGVSFRSKCHDTCDCFSLHIKHKYTYMSIQQVNGWEILFYISIYLYRHMHMTWK